MNTQKTNAAAKSYFSVLFETCAFNRNLNFEGSKKILVKVAALEKVSEHFIPDPEMGGGIREARRKELQSER